MIRKTIYHSKKRFLFLLILLLVTLWACNKPISPKPIGYCRIDLPNKEYKKIDEKLPFSCSIPVYAEIITIEDTMKDTQWYNIIINRYKATIHISYYNINRPLKSYIESSREFAFKHIDKASSIDMTEIAIAENDVYGLIYNINGQETASTTQFYVTDSVKHFLRGALYFEHAPNNDSIQPVIDFINKDINTMIRTFKWNEKTNNNVLCGNEL